jgi:eukaryotic-like serine/threonine-protein kinase
VAMHQEACEATRIRGEQTDAILALRMTCLDRRLQQVSALTRLFSTADLKIVEKSVDATNGLPGIDNCADIEALTSPVPRPDDPAARRSLEEVERSVSEARALTDAGRFRQALDVTNRLLSAPDLQKHPWAPLKAELLGLQGWCAFRTGDAATGEQTLREALLWAERGRHESERLRILSRLAYVLSAGSNQFDEAIYLGKVGEALASRSNDARAKVEMLTRLGNIYINKGEYEQGRATLERAAVLCEQSMGRDSPSLGTVLQSLGDAYARAGDYQVALQRLQTSLDISERTRGKSHPNVGYVHRTLAYVLSRLGDFERAHEEIQAGIKIWTNVYGPEHPEVAEALDVLATILHLDGLDAEALVEANKALKIKTKALGKDNPNLSYSMGNVGQALLGLKRYPEALAYLEKANQMQEKAKLSSEEIAEFRFAYARALWETKKDKNRALVLAAQARDGFRRGHDKRSEDEADRWLGAHGGGPTAARP